MSLNCSSVLSCQTTVPLRNNSRDRPISALPNPMAAAQWPHSCRVRDTSSRRWE